MSVSREMRGAAGPHYDRILPNTPGAWVRRWPSTIRTLVSVTLTTARPDARTAEESATDAVASLADPWITIVWNDPVNLMTYVTYVFESYFGYPPKRARTLMLQVHREGRAVVSTGPRERMEVDVQAMHGFGLWATMQRSSEGDRA